MTTEPHKLFLRRRHEIECDRSVFAPDEVRLLERFGAWFQALACGEIVPLTEQQQAFLLVHKGVRQPATVYESVWVKYQTQRIFELAQRTGAALAHGQYSYSQVCDLYLLAARLGHPAALQWLAEEGLSHHLRFAVSGNIPLDIPNVSPIETNRVFGPMRGKWVARLEPSSEDWGDTRDDFDSAFWESYLAGPDDSVFDLG